MRVYLINNNIAWFNSPYVKKLFSIIIYEYDESIIFIFIRKYLSLLIRESIVGGDILKIGHYDNGLCCLNLKDEVNIDDFQLGVSNLINGRLDTINEVIDIIIPDTVNDYDSIEESLIKIVEIFEFPYPISVSKIGSLDKIFVLDS